MYLQKKTTGTRPPKVTDLNYALQELKANNIPCTGYAVNNDGKTTEFDKAEPGASVFITIVKRKSILFVLEFGKRYGLEALQGFSAESKKAQSFKRAYVAAYGALVKKDGLRWSIGRVLNLVLSFFESARIENAANRELRKIDKKVKQVLAEMDEKS